MKTINLTRRANLSVLAVFVFFIIFEFTAKFYLPKASSLRNLTISLIEVAVFLIPSMLLVKSSGKKAFTFLKLKKFKMRWLPLILTVSLATSLGSIILNSLITALPFITKAKPLEAVTTPENMFTYALALVIIPAVFEEIFFRGALISSYQVKNQTIGIFASAIIFAMLHSSPSNFFGPFLAGITFALLTIVFDSIYPAIIAHFINNSISSTISTYSESFKAIGLNTYMIVTAVFAFLLLTYISLKLVEPYLTFKGKKADDNKLKSRLLRHSHSSIFSYEFLIIFAIWLVKITLKMAGVLP